MATDQRETQNNYHINSFTKGMNTDTSFDMINQDQYVFAQNVRIQNNALTHAILDANNKENILTPVHSGKELTIIKGKDFPNVSDILAIDTIESIGSIIVKDVDGFWYVYKIEYLDNEIKLTKIFKSTNKTKCRRFSTALNKETTEICKLYIADGESEVMHIDILKDPSYYENLTEYYLQSNNILALDKIQIVKKISGQLKTSQVQYTYRLYKKHGVCSTIAPLTNKIQIIDSNRNKEQGNAEDTTTSVGLQLSIPVSKEFQKVFDSIQIFRISYVKKNETPNIDLIQDVDLYTQNDKCIINDDGIKTLQSYSVDEFSSLYGTKIIPQVIENNHGYLFAANISDYTTIKIPDEYDMQAYSCNTSGQIVLYSDTQYENDPFKTYDYTKIDKEYYLNRDADMNVETSDNPCMYYKDPNATYSYLHGGSGKYISYRLVIARVPLHTNIKDTEVPFVNGDTVNTELKYLSSIGTEIRSNKTIWDYFDSKGVCNPFKDSAKGYDDIFVSSMLRSLKRDEVYRYGIVLYNNKGAKSDALWIADIKTPTIKKCPLTSIIEDTLYANVLGIQFDVNLPKIIDGNEIVGYEIVRCAKTNEYTKNITQCVLSRPVRQGRYVPGTRSGSEPQEVLNSYRAPYYANTFLTTQFEYIFLRKFEDWNRGDFRVLWNGPVSIVSCDATNVENNYLFQAFCPEYQIYKDDLINALKSNTVALFPVQTLDVTTSELNDKIAAKYKNSDNELIPGRAFNCITDQNQMYTFGSVIYNERTFTSGLESEDNKKSNFIKDLKDGIILYSPLFTNGLNSQQLSYPDNTSALNFGKTVDKNLQDEKISTAFTINMYNNLNPGVIKDSGFTKLDDSYFKPVEILAVEQTKQPNADEIFSDIQLSGSDVSGGVKQYKSYNTAIHTYNYVNCALSGQWDNPISKTDVTVTEGYFQNQYIYANDSIHSYTASPIGPAGLSFLIATSPIDGDNILTQQLYKGDTKSYKNSLMSTVLCNITKPCSQFAGLSKAEKQYDVYYGFGNFQKLNGDEQSTNIVFDGETYITLGEFTTIYKMYDFNAKSSINSMQLTYYVPMESKMNTCFDYGMNYRNTQNKNLQAEPNEITGVSIQDRPSHQYNSIYSDNDISSDIYSAKSENIIDYTFPQRIVYSELKTNGESIDSWHIFKPASFVDADSRFGEITNISTHQDILYCWQTSAFSRMSVNERSLVTDNNNNTIQLGQSGVLQRVDYIDEHYGMRKEDYSDISVNGTVLWIDIVNKALLAYMQGGIVNYTEQVNVQNLVNNSIDADIPTIHYDLQNNELLCGFLNIDDQAVQLVFNMKLNCATSIYSRVYDNIINMNNTLIGVTNSFDKALQYNNIEYSNEYPCLSPMKISFIVNSSPSQTKVFENQKVVVLKKQYDPEFVKQYAKNKIYTFTTDLGKSTIGSIEKELITDREGNILYILPRYNESINEQPLFGNRIRGKWLKVDINDKSPEYQFTISHIITKFRQSFS